MKKRDTRSDVGGEVTTVLAIKTIFFGTFIKVKRTMKIRISLKT